jgi:hypothetical protein
MLDVGPIAMANDEQVAARDGIDIQEVTGGSQCSQ